MDELKKRVHLSFDNFDIPVKEVLVKRVHIDYSLLTESSFFSRKMKASFARQMHQQSKRFQVNDTIVHLTIHNEDGDNHFDFFVNYIANCVRLMKQVFHKEIDEFVMILSLSKKRKSTMSKQTKDRHLSPDHINSGLSILFHNRSPPVIFIYRQQEICKVIVHELIHIYNIHPTSYSNEIDDELIKEYNLILRDIPSLNIFEAYVEFLAILLNAFMYDRMFKTNNSIRKEYDHQLYTVNQLNNYKPYSQSTNVFSYVYLKTHLMNHMDNILERTKDDNFTIKDVSLIVPKTRMAFKRKKYKFSSRIRLNFLDIFKTYLKLHQL